VIRIVRAEKKKRKILKVRDTAYEDGYLTVAKKSCQMSFRQLSILPLLGTALLLGMSSVVLSRFEAQTEGSDVVVTWQASVETNVMTYALERKTRYDSQFKELTRIAAKGPNQLHQYRDTKIYKAAGEQVQYRLRIIYADQSFVTVDPVSVDYTPTAIRRTWGSIKAMFQ